MVSTVWRNQERLHEDGRLLQNLGGTCLPGSPGRAGYLRHEIHPEQRHEAVWCVCVRKDTQCD